MTDVLIKGVDMDAETSVEGGQAHAEDSHLQAQEPALEQILPSQALEGTGLRQHLDLRPLARRAVTE